MTDAIGRFVVKILVGILNGSPSKPMLLATRFLEKANNVTISQCFLDCLQIIWPNKIQYNKVILVVTDQASYMIKAIKSLKLMFPNLHHITCIVHALHRVCEVIREENIELNIFISNMKKVLKNSNSRILVYKETTGLPLPPDPIVTRWGTWVKTGLFYLENFNKIGLFVDNLKDDSLAIKKVKEIIKKEALQDQLQF